ncbi:LOW QUALITY PROTEIN: tripartite motif-containing protein 59 [Erethizon dorsatum]
MQQQLSFILAIRIVSYLLPPRFPQGLVNASLLNPSNAGETLLRASRPLQSSLGLSCDGSYHEEGIAPHQTCLVVSSPTILTMGADYHLKDGFCSSLPSPGLPQGWESHGLQTWLPEPLILRPLCALPPVQRSAGRCESAKTQGDWAANGGGGDFTEQRSCEPALRLKVYTGCVGVAPGDKQSHRTASSNVGSRLPARPTSPRALAPPHSSGWTRVSRAQAQKSWASTASGAPRLRLRRALREALPLSALKRLAVGELGGAVALCLQQWLCVVAHLFAVSLKAWYLRRRLWNFLVSLLFWRSTAALLGSFGSPGGVRTAAVDAEWGSLASEEGGASPLRFFSRRPRFREARERRAERGNLPEGNEERLPGLGGVFLKILVYYHALIHFVEVVWKTFFRHLCPNCRSITEIAPTGIESLPVNFALKAIIEKQQEDHPDVVFCPEHNRQPLNVYCLLDKKLVCGHCLTIGQHHGHPIDDLQSAYLEEKDTPQKLLKQLTDIHWADITYLTEKLEQQKSHSQEMIEGDIILQYFEELIDTLEQKKIFITALCDVGNLINEEYTPHIERMKEIREQQLELMTLTSSLQESPLKFPEKVGNICQHVQILKRRPLPEVQCVEIYPRVSQVLKERSRTEIGEIKKAAIPEMKISSIRMPSSWPDKDVEFFQILRISMLLMGTLHQYIIITLNEESSVYFSEVSFVYQSVSNNLHDLKTILCHTLYLLKEFMWKIVSP